ncbi:hypothetical protein EIP86_005099 [Pleurotus ostreatoroseus]|nr:hypothetical protein EIP86_005099 [Pleurotus ostreatoroseus]
MSTSAVKASSSLSAAWHGPPDLILQSPDGKQFRVHMKILSSVSSVFNGMVGLPQPTAEADALPTVAVAEDSDTIQVLLDALYPGRYPSTTLDLAALSKVARAAEKYDMACVMAFVAHCLQSSRFEDEPLRIYAIAQRFGLRAIAADAAKASLRHPWSMALPPEFEELSAVAYHQLLLFRRRCEDVFDTQFDSESCRTYEEFTQFMSMLPTCSDCAQSSYGPLQKPIVHSRPSWFITHLHLAKQEFTQRVEGSTLMSPLLLNKTIRELRSGEPYARCGCAVLGPIKLMEFSQFYAAFLDRALDKVYFDTDGVSEDSEDSEMD